MKGTVQKLTGDRYRIGIYVNGKKQWITNYVDGKPIDGEILERALHRIRSEIDGGTFRIDNWRKSSLYIFKNAVQDYQDSNRASPEWEYNRGNIIDKHILPYFAEKNIKNIDSVLIRDWWKERVDSLNYSPSFKREIKKMMLAIMKFHNDIVRVPKFPKVKVKARKITHPTVEDQAHIMEFIPDQHKAIFTLILESGCRPCEAIRLRKTDVDRIVGKITFRNTKNGKDRDYPIMPSFEDALKLRDLVSPYAFSWGEGHKYNRKHLSKVWNKANAKATQKHGTQHYRMYDNRSACASRLAPKMDAKTLCGAMGHDIRTSLKYYIDTDIEALRKALGTRADTTESK